MNYYCYCNSKIKNVKTDSIQMKIYPDENHKIKKLIIPDNKEDDMTSCKIELKNHEIFKHQTNLTYFNTYNDFFIIAFDNRNECSRIYKTDKEFNIVQSKIFSKHLSVEKNAKINRNNLIFSKYNYFYKLNLDTFEIQTPSQEIELNGNYYNDFDIHKKNNCIYVPHCIYNEFEKDENKRWNLCISVINIKTLNVIKRIYIIDPNLYLQQVRSCWCVVQGDKLIINIQFDHSGGFNVLITLKGIDKKQVPKTCDVAEYYCFIDEYCHLYKNYLYMDGKGLIYDINNNKFIGLSDNYLNLTHDSRTCYDNHYWKIYKNYLIIIRNEYEQKNKNELCKLYIVNLDKSPFLGRVAYDIQLTEIEKCENNFCIDDNKLYVMNHEKHVFNSYELPLVK
jgi:hypothetical protein